MGAHRVGPSVGQAEGRNRRCGKVRHFELLDRFLPREPEAGEYAAMAADLGVSAGAIGVSVHRLRRRFRELVRAEIADTVADRAQVETEMRVLLDALRG